MPTLGEGDGGIAEPEMFVGEFRRKLAQFKYTQWAADLTQGQLRVVLWAIGELGYRSQSILKYLDRHEDELPGGYPLARLAFKFSLGWYAASGSRPMR